MQSLREAKTHQDEKKKRDLFQTEKIQPQMNKTLQMCHQQVKKVVN